ncbi:DUF4920 domain-containing protein [Rhodoflexus caldus]|uniref:DUF4920 domain-containing protein n=1 Tax=Rhodoflexus caldus TaxID=2891236 RepID=UPI00202A1011|nr:DUF4920 domain-containing protein [Rhodoflexus caldus]
MRNNLFALLLICLTAFSTQLFAQDNLSYYGDKITEEGAIAASEISQLMKDKQEGTFKVKGTIVQTCLKKGCWMTVDIGNNEKMTVRFKDYGFFVPKSGADGLEVVFEGVARKEMRSVEELRHYAQDAGKSKEEIAQIIAPKEEITFEASGVIIKGYKKK